jgi:hypothetical protein
MEILVHDGDTLTIVVKLGASVMDPNGDFPGVVAAYRVIANLGSISNPVLELVRLGAVVSLRKSEAEDVARRKS